MNRLLPDKPSELIELALADLRKVEKNEEYVVRMDTWHIPDYEGSGRCAVCWAGAVMAGTLGADRNKILDPFDFHARDKLQALEWMRTGNIETGLYLMGIRKMPDGVPRAVAVDYVGDREHWHHELGALAGRLRALGH